MNQQELSSGNQNLDHSLDWLCKKVDKVLDFGCGDGKMLYLCAARGTKTHIGIDVSPAIIQKAKREVEKSVDKRFYFRCGGISEFTPLLTNSLEAIIIFNRLEQMRLEEIEKVLDESKRVLNKDGKLLIKIGKNNKSVFKTKEEWKTEITKYFLFKDCCEVYYRENDERQNLFSVFKQELLPQK